MTSAEPRLRPAGTPASRDAFDTDERRHLREVVRRFVAREVLGPTEIMYELIARQWRG